MNPSSTAGNAPEYSVSELAGALKRALEDQFGYVRVRGEISGYRGPHSSGHAYFCFKDQNARIDAVVWRSTFGRLKIKPQDGLEVIATGKITTFAGKSTYQLVVETLAPAGVGALMALLEERRRKLQAEGLFDTSRKRALPYLPRVIGVVTSPTGAVIRDILHRLSDRFPRPVLVWPVRVQGETAADEVAAAIRGFNALPAGGRIPRPDVLIVARGGGSLEDLWAFNEEIVVRAAAESQIPLISAIGHETDTTLIDHAADFRAPTPTGAAEKAVPVCAELVSCIRELGNRQREAAWRGLDRRRTELRSAIRALPTPDALLAAKRQRIDLAGARLKPALAANRRKLEVRLSQAGGVLARYSPHARLAGMRARLDGLGHRLEAVSQRPIQVRREKLAGLAGRLAVARQAALRAETVRIAQGRMRVDGAQARLAAALAAQIERKAARLDGLAALFASLNYRAVLARGYALVLDASERPVRESASVLPGQALTLEFSDGRAAVVGAGTGRPSRRVASAPRLVQGTLFDA